MLNKLPFMKNVSCTLFLCLWLLASCKKDKAPDPGPAQPLRIYYPWTQFVMGADLSYVNAVEDGGGSYKDSGKLKDPFLLFRDKGTNTVRVRLWHNPSWQAGL